MDAEHSKYRGFLRGNLFSTRGSEASQVLSRGESRLTANLETLRRTDQNLEILRRTDLAEPEMEFREFQLFGEVTVAALHFHAPFAARARREHLVPLVQRLETLIESDVALQKRLVATSDLLSENSDQMRVLAASRSPCSTTSLRPTVEVVRTSGSVCSPTLTDESKPPDVEVEARPKTAGCGTDTRSRSCTFSKSVPSVAAPQAPVKLMSPPIIALAA
eukprot:3637752-Prymnesium_polylepis.1